MFFQLETAPQETKVDEDQITRIYACGTMWHETREEMMEFLKSVYRMDEDQAAHRIVKQYLHYPVDGYYEWESKLFKKNGGFYFFIRYIPRRINHEKNKLRKFNKIQYINNKQ